MIGREVVRRWALGAGLALAAVPAAAQNRSDASGVPSAIPVQARCVPRETCWFDQWGATRCFRRWVCDGPAAPGRWRRRARRRSLEDDYPPASGDYRDDRRAPWWAERRWDPERPQVVRPRPRLMPAPRGRRRAALDPRLRLPPGATVDRTPPAGTDRETPDIALRPRPAPTRPTPTRAPARDNHKVTARLTQPPPATDRREVDRTPASPARTPVRHAATAPDRKAAPVARTPAAKPDVRRALRLPDDIDRLPHGRKIPMEEIDPGKYKKPKKKLRERFPI